jgi:hypothetical protein
MYSPNWHGASGVVVWSWSGLIRGAGLRIALKAQNISAQGNASLRATPWVIRPNESALQGQNK